MSKDKIAIIGPGDMGKLIYTKLGDPIIIIDDHSNLRGTTTEIVSLNQFQAPVLKWSEPIVKKKRGSNLTPKKKKRK